MADTWHISQYVSVFSSDRYRYWPIYGLIHADIGQYLTVSPIRLCIPIPLFKTLKWIGWKCEPGCRGDVLSSKLFLAKQPAFAIAQAAMAWASSALHWKTTIASTLMMDRSHCNPWRRGRYIWSGEEERWWSTNLFELYIRANAWGPVWTGVMGKTEGIWHVARRYRNWLRARLTPIIVSLLATALKTKLRVRCRMP